MAWLTLTPDSLVPTTTLAEKTQVPQHYLAKVLQQLASAGLIRGRRGVRGGYQLNRRPDSISLIEVVRAVAQVDRITRCPLGLENHGSNLCPLHRRVDEANRALIDVYSNVTLQDLVDDPGQSKPLCDRHTTARLTVSAVAPGSNSHR